MNATKTINACGLSCPQPALLTHQALSSLTAGTVHMLIDSSTARDNVVRTAQKEGWEVSIQNQPDGIYQVTLTK